MQKSYDLVEAARAIVLGRTNRPDLLQAALQLRSITASCLRPFAAASERIGVRAPLSAQLKLQAYPLWPADVAAVLQRLPFGFVDGGSIKPDTAFWLFRYLLERRPSLVFEVGCGVSTIVTAVALERLSDPLRRPRCIAVSGNIERMEQVRELLHVVGLQEVVELRNSTAQSEESGGRGDAWHGLDQAELLLLRQEIARLEDAALRKLLERLQPGAVILVDEAASPAAQEQLNAWTNSGAVKLRDYVARGAGLAILERVTS